MPGAIAQRKIGAPHSSLYIGPAGWSYEDWEGIVYARPRVRGFRPLAYLAHYFNCVEINSTFYRIPPPSVADKWVAQVEPFDDFLFSVKLWEGFTHVPASGGQVDAQALKQWGAALDPLRRSDRLGAVLVQFPWSFRRTRANASYLDVLTENLTPDPLVIEMRHDSWNSKDYLAWLRERACAFCNIDQPLLSRCLPPTEHVTASLAYVRFHGRNRENWFREDAEVAERYKYLYSKEGLSDWVERFRRLI
ncbi:DUF72 domain-containing protein, partial [Candidatus Sumerlaeota bacterium]|nr:DUF72 domain-containing protein [Candidatus Sumerlaeota bacterium]